MGFWGRYLVLILLCVIAPLGLGFYVDTQSEIRRAAEAGENAAEAAQPALTAQLTLHAHRLVGRALAAAQSISDERLVPSSKSPSRPENIFKLSEIAVKEMGRGGFAWVVDETGTIVARSPESPDMFDRITGHPLFAATQRGYGLDGFWSVGDKVYFVGAAPLVKEDEARGAVLIADPIDQDMVINLGKQIGTDITVLVDKELIASSLPSDIVAPIIPKLTEANTSEPVHAGRRATPLPSAELPFLPLFVAKDAEGIAYASLAREAPGASGVRWVISVPTTQQLQYLAERQQTILAVLVAAFLIALVFGMMMHRSYVRPIGRLVGHLSELQHGRGERELPESAMPGPFRRLVKLINMTVQRIPTSTFGFGDEPSGRASLNVAEVSQNGSDDLGMAMIPSVPPSPVYNSQPFEPPSIQGIPSPPASPPAQPAPVLRSQSAMSKPPLTPAPQLAPSSTPRPLSGAAMGLEDDPASSGIRRAPRSASQIRGTPSHSLSDTSVPINLQTGDIRAPRLSDEPDISAPTKRIPSAQTAKGVVSGAAAADEHGHLLAYLDELRAAPPGGEGADPFGGPAIPAAKTASSRMGGSAAGAGFGSAGIPNEDSNPGDSFRSEATVVAAPDYSLLNASRREVTGGYTFDQETPHDRTLVAETPEHLLSESRGENGDPSENAHFKETYERFLEMRKQCGEPTSDLAFDRFVAKLRKNRDGLIKKYNCKTVRFQVYEKDGKAALKATPVRS